jgi:hypothetical protein
MLLHDMRVLDREGQRPTLLLTYRRGKKDLSGYVDLEQKRINSHGLVYVTEMSRYLRPDNPPEDENRFSMDGMTDDKRVVDAVNLVIDSIRNETYDQLAGVNLLDLG